MIIVKRIIGSMLIMLGLLVGILPFVLHLRNDSNDAAFKALGTGMAPIAIGVWLWQRRKIPNVEGEPGVVADAATNTFLIKSFWYIIMGVPVLLVVGIIAYLVYVYIKFLNS
jgi:hypothetical protein